MSEIWTVDRVVELERLALGRVSAAEIAARMGLEPVQVIGKARRLGLKLADGLSATAEITPTPAPEKPVAPRPIETPTSAKPAPAPRRGSIDVGKPSDGWTDARIAVLRQMLEAGKPASDVADALGGVTRNACIGKAHRLGLTFTSQHGGARKFVKVRGTPSSLRPLAAAPRLVGPAKVARRSPAPRYQPRPEPARLPLPAAEPVARETALSEIEKATADGDFPHATSIMELRPRSCRFPLWGSSAPAGATSLYCGAPSRDDACPYCPGHAALCLQPYSGRTA